MEESEVSESKRDAAMDWAKFLNPNSLKGNLITASLFLAAYETLRASVIDQIRDFFTNGFNENGYIVDDRYKADVLARDKSPLRASLLWLKEQGVIDENDMRSVDEIREHRNELAHDLPKFITTTESEINAQLLSRIVELLAKIEKWWILEVEIPTDPDFDNRNVGATDVVSGRMLFLQMMLQIASGEDDASYWNEFERLFKRSV